MHLISVASSYKSGYSRFMQYIMDVLNHPRRHEIERRLDIIKFFDQFGPVPTQKAFHKSRSTIYLWKHRLAKAGGKLSALAPGNKTPLHKRKRFVHPFVENFIVKYRQAHPGADKTTLTPALRQACQQMAIKPISESTVGRLIHDLKASGKILQNLKILHKGDTGKIYFYERKPSHKKLRRKGYVPRQPGDLVEMDTVSIFACGLKRYLFTALDIKSRLAFAFAYKANSSANGEDFLKKFVKVTPFVTNHIQTDNGGEFANHFDRCCKENDLVHFFNYPKHPQANAHLERFNKTIQEQFVYSHIDELDELHTFNRNLMEYLIWYNTEKPHRGIDNLPPLRYYLNNYFQPLQKSDMLWTHTFY